MHVSALCLLFISSLKNQVIALLHFSSFTTKTTGRQVEKNLQVSLHLGEVSCVFHHAAVTSSTLAPPSHQHLPPSVMVQPTCDEAALFLQTYISSGICVTERVH